MLPNSILHSVSLSSNDSILFGLFCFLHFAYTVFFFLQIQALGITLQKHQSISQMKNGQNTGKFMKQKPFSVSYSQVHPIIRSNAITRPVECFLMKKKQQKRRKANLLYNTLKIPFDAVHYVNQCRCWLFSLSPLHFIHHFIRFLWFWLSMSSLWLNSIATFMILFFFLLFWKIPNNLSQTSTRTGRLTGQMGWFVCNIRVNLLELLLFYRTPMVAEKTKWKQWYQTR